MAMSFNDFYRGKRVLITGHTGFKGSWLTQWLSLLGADVCGYSVDIPSSPSHFEILDLKNKMKHVIGDIRNAASLKRCFDDFQPEIVFHLAAQALVRESYDFPVETFDVNLTGTVQVLDAIRKTPSVRTGLIITTDKCYENKEWEFGYRENDRLGGKDPYSASKACAEIAFTAFYKSFFDQPGAARIASARAGNVIGGGDWAKDRIVPDCVRAWARGEKPLIRNPNSTRPWQHVLEPLSGYLWLVARMSRASHEDAPLFTGQSFNFGPLNDANQTVRALTDEARKTWPNCAIQIDPIANDSKKEAVLLQLNCERAWQRLAWQATLTFSETVRLTSHWYREYYEGKSSIADFSSSQIREYEHMARQKQKMWALSEARVYS